MRLLLVGSNILFGGNECSQSAITKLIHTATALSPKVKMWLQGRKNERVREMNVKIMSTVINYVAALSGTLPLLWRVAKIRVKRSYANVEKSTDIPPQIISPLKWVEPNEASRVRIVISCRRAKNAGHIMPTGRQTVLTERTVNSKRISNIANGCLFFIRGEKRGKVTA